MDSPDGARSLADTMVLTAPTLDGWYAHHQVFTIDRAAVRDRAVGPGAQQSMSRALEALATPAEGGWTVPVQLVGSSADLMLVQMRPTLDAIAAAQHRVLAEPCAEVLGRAYDFLSVTEAGMYSAAVKSAAEVAARGGTIGDPEHRAALAARLEAERVSPHVARRLFPPAPTEATPYVCFYPMSKRRAVGQNWYALSGEERSRLMWEHGKTGRRYAGRVSQIISGALGFDAWEWGVTLFAADALEFKRIVTEMRFDEVSAQYAEFGPFYVGKVVTPTAWAEAIVGHGTL